MFYIEYIYIYIYIYIRKNYHRQKASNARFQNSLLCNLAFALADKILTETSLYTKALRIFLEEWKIKVSLKVRFS